MREKSNKPQRERKKDWKCLKTHRHEELLCKITHVKFHTESTNNHLCLCAHLQTDTSVHKTNTNLPLYVHILTYTHLFTTRVSYMKLTCTHKNASVCVCVSGRVCIYLNLQIGPHRTHGLHVWFADTEQTLDHKRPKHTQCLNRTDWLSLVDLYPLNVNKHIS